eukprot:14959-Eustigmatos_ZCMA.PRE.1
MGNDPGRLPSSVISTIVCRTRLREKRVKLVPLRRLLGSNTYQKLMLSVPNIQSKQERRSTRSIIFTGKPLWSERTSS